CGDTTDPRPRSPDETPVQRPDRAVRRAWRLFHPMTHVAGSQGNARCREPGSPCRSPAQCASPGCARAAAGGGVLQNGGASSGGHVGGAARTPGGRSARVRYTRPVGVVTTKVPAAGCSSRYPPWVLYRWWVTHSGPRLPADVVPPSPNGTVWSSSHRRAGTAQVGNTHVSSRARTSRARRADGR